MSNKNNAKQAVLNMVTYNHLIACVKDETGRVFLMNWNLFSLNSTLSEYIELKNNDFTVNKDLKTSNMGENFPDCNIYTFLNSLLTIK